MEKLENLGERTPPPTTALILEMTGLETARDQLGMRFCVDRSVGPMRRKLGRPPIFFAPPLGELERAVEIAHDGARILLLGLCERCPFKQCKMKVW